MAATIIYDSLSGLHDVNVESINNGDVLVWVASTNSWNPRPYNDGSGNPSSMIMGNPVIGGQPLYVLYIDENGNLNQWQYLSQGMVKDLISDLGSKAPVDSPYLTGTPMAAPPDPSDSSLRIATTGFVHGQGFEQSVNKGQPYGYPSLDDRGQVPVEQLPSSIFGGVVLFPVAILDVDAPNGSLYKGFNHNNKLCYKDDGGVIHELYS
jgi:hypothetical protein